MGSFPMPAMGSVGLNLTGLAPATPSMAPANTTAADTTAQLSVSALLGYQDEESDGDDRTSDSGGPRANFVQNEDDVAATSRFDEDDI